MATLTSSGLRGFVPVTVTPFDESGALRADWLEQVLRWHVDQRAEGLLITADNGESWSLTAAERRTVAEVAVKVAGGRIPVVMGILGGSTTSNRTLAEHAAEGAAAGVDALLVSPSPYLGKATRGEVVARYRGLHRAVGLPIVVYNNPRHFGVGVEGDTLAAVCDAADVIGIKESSRDFLHVTETIARFGDRLSVFVGCGWYIMPGLMQGAAGFLSTGPDLLGRDARRIVELATGPASEEARAMHRRIARLYTFLLGTATPPAALKAALGLLGLPAGVPRAPVEPLAADDLRALTALMQESGALRRDAA